jgi:hypothetical protein
MVSAAEYHTEIFAIDGTQAIRESSRSKRIDPKTLNRIHRVFAICARSLFDL